MQILACSDLHCDVDATKRIVAQSGQADLLVVAGDLGTKGQGAEPVLALLKTAPCPVILVPGNHDRLIEMRQFCNDWKGGTLLHGEMMTFQGVPFFGLGAETPRCGDDLWRFSMSEVQAQKALAACPKGAVLVTHSPPKGHCDRHIDGTQAGSEAVLECLRIKQPRVHLCGHIHAAFGQTSKVGECTIYNLGPNTNWISV